MRPLTRLMLAMALAGVLVLALGHHAAHQGDADHGMCLACVLLPALVVAFLATHFFLLPNAALRKAIPVALIPSRAHNFYSAHPLRAPPVPTSLNL